MAALLSDSTTDLIVRMLRLPEPSSEAVRYVLLAIGLMLGGLIALWIVGRRSELNGERAADAARLRRILSGADLGPEEFVRFEEVVAASGASALECATNVECFDRGVKNLLGSGFGVEPLRDLHALRSKLVLAGSRPGSPLRSTRSLLPGQQLLLVHGWQEGEETLPAVLHSVEENALTVRMQGSAGDLEPRLRGCGELSVIFHRQGDASYTFRSRVLERRTESEVFLVLAHPDELTRIQKRGFARVEVGARVKFRWIPGRRGAGTVHQGILTDLSANGVGLRTDQCLEPGDLVTLTLDFLPPPAGSQALSAQVVVKRGDGSRGLKFEGLPPQARSEILKFVRSREVEKAAAKRGSGAGSQVASAPETISEREGEVKNVY